MAEEEERKDINERIRELQEEGLDKYDIARNLIDEGYPVNLVAKALHVSISKLTRGQGERISKNANADQTVLDASAVKTLEELKEWAKRQTHLTISEIAQLGQTLIELGIKEKAAAMGLPLWDYVRNAINFYNTYYSSFVQLLALKVVDLDGRINMSLIKVEEAKA